MRRGDAVPKIKKKTATKGPAVDSHPAVLVEEPPVAEEERIAKPSPVRPPKKKKAVAAIVVDNDDPVLWRKKGKGSFRLGNGQIIKPEQTFEARPSEVPKAFRDSIKQIKAPLKREAVDALPLEEPKVEEPKVEKPPKESKKSKVVKEPEPEEEVRADGKIKWRKHGAGSFKMGNGRIIKKGQVFWAREDEIPQGFRDNIKPLALLLEKEGPKIVSTTEFEIVEHKIADLEGLANSTSSKKIPMYDVINKASGKAMNEEPYTKEAAVSLMSDLT